MIKFNESIVCNTTKSEVKKAIKQIYEQYKTFMGIYNLTDFEIEFFEYNKWKNEPVAFVCMPTDENPKYILNVCIDILNALQHRSLKTLYHEFTHILDNEINLIGETYENKNFFLDVYTEFNATLTELKVATGFVSNDYNKKLSLESIYMDSFEDMTLKQYFIKELSSFQKELPKYKENYSPEVFKYLKNHVIYYIAKICFAEKYIMDFTTDLFDLKLFGDLLGEEIYTIKDLLYKQFIKIDTNELIDIKRLEMSMIKRFSKNYKQ